MHVLCIPRRRGSQCDDQLCMITLFSTGYWGVYYYQLQPPWPICFLKAQSHKRTAANVFQHFFFHSVLFPFALRAAYCTARAVTYCVRFKIP